MGWADKRILFAAGFFLSAAAALAQTPPPPSAVVAGGSGIPKPGPVVKGKPYQPQTLLPGGIVMPLWPAGSSFLNAKRASEAEIYTMDPFVPGRVERIINIHNPSIEVHLARSGDNTGAAVILVPGGGHNTLVVGIEGIDPVPFFFNYGVTTVILRNRLRKDGYDAKLDAVYDLQQAIRLVRAHAAEWKLDPKKIGVMGFSAGAELTMAAAIQYPEFDAKNNGAGDPLAGITSRPDFVGSIYPGPSLFTKGGTPPIPKDAPPSFLICPGWGDKVHAVWADEYFSAMLNAGIPNLEMHIYAIGTHGRGLSYREGTALGTWPARFTDWFRDLGFLNKPGVETLAARESAAFVKGPPPK